MNYKRECGGCTGCCEGWLSVQVYEQYAQPGRPCHFKCESGCSIYEDRPDVCKIYKCEWLTNLDIPEWIKPNISGVIITKRKWSDGDYLEVLETNRKIDAEVLNWFFIYHLTTNIPLRIQVSKGWNNYGPLEFRQEMMSKK